MLREQLRSRSITFRDGRKLHPDIFKIDLLSTNAENDRRFASQNTLATENTQATETFPVASLRQNKSHLAFLPCFLRISDSYACVEQNKMAAANPTHLCARWSEVWEHFTVFPKRYLSPSLQNFSALLLSLSLCRHTRRRRLRQGCER